MGPLGHKIWYGTSIRYTRYSGTRSSGTRYREGGPVGPQDVVVLDVVVLDIGEGGPARAQDVVGALQFRMSLMNKDYIW